MDYDEYITTAQTKNILRVTPETLRNWHKQGKIKCIRTPSNHRLYSKADVLRIAGVPQIPVKSKKYLYCRVSSKNQMDDLERQKIFLQSKFPDYICISDVGSGLNWKRKGLKTILEQSMSGNVKEVVVAHKDRLCRFAFELLKFIFETNGVKLTVLNDTDGKSSDEELTEDILSIIHVYSCRKMGRRRYKNKANTNIPEETPKEDTQGVDTHDQVCL